jgi:hypothetical protein
VNPSSTRLPSAGSHPAVVATSEDGLELGRVTLDDTLGDTLVIAAVDTPRSLRKLHEQHSSPIADSSRGLQSLVGRMIPQEMTCSVELFSAEM